VAQTAPDDAKAPCTVTARDLYAGIHWQNLSGSTVVSGAPTAGSSNHSTGGNGPGASSHRAYTEHLKTQPRILMCTISTTADFPG